MNRLVVVILFVAGTGACGPQASTEDATPAAVSELVAYTGAVIWDGSGRAPRHDAALLVRDGRIVAVTASPPAATRVVPLDGLWIVPGLVNVHGHVSGRWAADGVTDAAQRVVADLQLYARYGVTTVVSLGDEPAEAFAVREQQGVAGPGHARLQLAGTVVTPADPHVAASEASRNVAAGVDWMKIRVDDNLGTGSKMPWPAVAAVFAVADAADIPMATHVFYHDDALRLLDLGTDLIAHSIRDQRVDRSFINAMLAAGVCYVPTLVREVSTFVYAARPAFFDDSFFHDDAFRQETERVSDPQYMRRVAASPAAARYREALVQAQENLKVLQEAGVPIAFGTDSGPPARFPGYFEHLELALMTKAGLTAEQALLSATSVAAACMGLADVGTLEPGKWADFLVLRENPLADIAATRTLERVYIAGTEVPRP